MLSKIVLIIGLSVMAVATACSSPDAHAQVVPDCLNIDTFPTVQVPITQGEPVPTAAVPKCIAGCLTVRPPRCTDVDDIFPPVGPVQPRNPRAVGDYSDVVCTDISTFPQVVRKTKTYPKCVQKCQTVRPPNCVDYNTELQ